MNKKLDKPLTLAIACGGTGGHFYPGLTIAKEFNRRGGKAVLFIAGHQSRNQINIALHENVAAIATMAFRLPSKRIQLPLFGFQFVYTLFTHLKLFSRYQIDTALCMGSYASAPIGIAAALARKPLTLHEGNAVLGRTNRSLSKWARVLALSFPLKNEKKTQMLQKVVGMPLRESIIHAGSVKINNENRNDLYRKYNLKSNLPTLLVFGGSQGAKSINRLILNAISQMKTEAQKFQIIHLTGDNQNSEFLNIYQSKGLVNLVKKNDDAIENLFQLADLIVCRAGASTIFELAYFGKPALFIPLAAAMDNHQEENILKVLEVDGGILLKEKNTIVQEFLDLIESWLAAPGEFYKKGQNLKKLARPKATEEIVDLIYSYFN